MTTATLTRAESKAAHDRLVALHGNRCSICGRPPREGGRRLDVDHDHKTGRVRGLLCHRCNRGLPAWATAEWLRACADYLEAHTPGGIAQHGRGM